MTKSLDLYNENRWNVQKIIKEFAISKWCWVTTCHISDHIK